MDRYSEQEAIVIPGARQTIREKRQAVAGIVVSVVPQDISERKAVIGSQAVIELQRLLSRPPLGAEVGLKVVSVGEHVGRRAVRQREKSERILGNFIEPLSWQEIPLNRIADEATTRRIRTSCRRVEERDERPSGGPQLGKISAALSRGRHGIDYGVGLAQPPLFKIKEEERPVPANRSADRTPVLVVA